MMDGNKDLGSGRIGAIIGFLLALHLVLFGFWKTLFIFIFTFVGYLLGIRYFSGRDSFRKLLDKIFPPGLFR